MKPGFIVEITSPNSPKFQLGERAYIKYVEPGGILLENARIRGTIVPKEDFKVIPFMKFFPGDKIILKRNTRGTPFRNGEEVTIFSVNHLQSNYVILRDNMGWCFNESDVMSVTDKEPEKIEEPTIVDTDDTFF